MKFAFSVPKCNSRGSSMNIYKIRDFSSRIFKKFPARYNCYLNYLNILKCRLRTTQFLATPKETKEKLFDHNYLAIFLALCQLSELESPSSQTAGAKFSLSSVWRKSENFNESGYFWDGPCRNCEHFYVGHPKSIRTVFVKIYEKLIYNFWNQNFKRSVSSYLIDLPFS